MPLPREGGLLLVYLRPLSQESARLRFRIDRLDVAGGVGARFPLSLRLDDIGSDRAPRERLLAAGPLPPGRYSGLGMAIASASLRGEEGTADLVVPETPVMIPVEFTVAAGGAVVLSLELDFRASTEGGFRFTPAFAASVPPRPAPDLLALVSSRGADLLTLFDKQSGRVVGAIRTGRRPAGLALDEAVRRAYVAASGEDAVQAVDLLEHRLLSRADLRGGDEPIGLALTPDGRTLLSANRGSSTVSFIDTLSMVETDRLQLQEGMNQIVNREEGAIGERPAEILVDRVGRRAYVFNAASGSITVIDVAARAVAGTIATEPGPFRGDFNRLQDRLFVIHGPSPYVGIVDAAALEVVSRIYVGPGLTAIKVNPETDRVYLASGPGRSLEIYDPMSLLPVDSIPIDGRVSYLAIDDEGNNLFAVLSDRDEVQILGIVSRRAMTRIDLQDEPYDVVLSGER
jgi:YVTN family beta-propeller protein